MNILLRKRAVRIFLSVCVILSLALFMDFIVTHAEHHCSGADCPICAIIHTALNLLGSLVLVYAVSLALRPFISEKSHFALFAVDLFLLTPFRLKVKLNR